MKRAAALLLFAIACRHETPAPSQIERPSILLVTLDTTRADAIGDATPSFNTLAKRGRVFDFAYAAVPQTLPSHSSIMTGLYPAGHGVRENARFLDASHPTLAEKLKTAGYRTAAFVSAFAVAKRFGLGRGFDVYEEDFGKDRAERNAKETTDLALKYLASPSNAPLFLWVHYYDPHYPYTPPEPFKSKFANDPYKGEIAFMDEQLGRLLAAFKGAVIVVADHGEGLGEHGEQQHGNLLYQTTMHVPLVIAGPGFSAGHTTTPFSTRQIFQTVLGWAGIETEHAEEQVIAGESMKPFLDYGWQPQVMAVEGNRKAIMAGRLEVYDVVADPHEMHNLAAQGDITRGMRATLRDYPIPSAAAAQAPATLDDEAQKKLASIGYVSATSKPVIRKDAPVPADMAPLFPILDRASGLFVRQQYAAAIPLLEEIQRVDPHNLDAALRLATAHSALGHDKEALAAFANAQTLAPDSPDVRTYLALHYAKGPDWEKAVPLLERIVREEPDRLPPLEALAVIRERQGRVEDAVALREKIYTMRTATDAELRRLGSMQMAMGQTDAAIATLEKVRGADLELGVLYLAANRLADARDALDRVPPSHPGYAMALFKRAQVSVLLHESDAAARIAFAKQHADATTRVLIERERLFQ